MPDDGKTYGGRRLDPRHRLELLADSEGVTEDAVVSLWTSEGALDPERARQRAGDVLFVAVDETNTPIGVSTVTLTHIDQLRTELWYYRTFVAKDHRAGSLAWVMMYASIDHLRDRYTSGEDTRGPGMFMAVQNRGLKSTRDMAMWERSRFAFVGEDAKGAHLRVLWFPGSEAPLPD